jgi:uncharacterized NAD(P)/FAD-binding protein YdhS
MRRQRIFYVGGSAASFDLETERDPLAGLLPAGNARYLRSPCDEDDLARIGATDRVLVLGAGLTALDVALELDEQGHRAPIRLVARHGLAARTQRLVGPPVADRLTALLAAGRLEVRAGEVRGAAAYGDTFVVDILPRGRTTHSSERYDWIVNATGAEYPRHLRAAARTAQHVPS